MSSEGKKPTNSGKIIVKVLLVVLALLVAAAVGLYAFIQVKLGEINRIQSTSFHEQTATSSEDSSWEAMGWNEAGIATRVDGVVNILLVGQDTRSDERDNSDTMIVLSINKNTNQITMISLMRDIYLPIPDYKDNKLNSTYLMGGFDLLDATIEQNFDIAIDYNVEVGFTGFKDIIEILGGIDMELNQEEADYINKKVSNSELTEGINHLNGSQALCFARTRYVGKDDFERTERQRRVMEQIYEDLKGASIFKLLEVYDSIADDIVTDMDNNQILSIAYAAYTMNKDSLNSYRIPLDGTWHTESKIGKVVDALVIDDWDTNLRMIQEYLYSDDAGVSAQEETEEELSGQTTTTTTPSTTTTTPSTSKTKN
jgi:LCP family protein required for cell wall assembly